MKSDGHFHCIDVGKQNYYSLNPLQHVSIDLSDFLTSSILRDRQTNHKHAT